MKKIIFTVVAITSLLGASFTAQAQKFGHLNAQTLLSQMPEVTTADKQLEEFNKSLEDQLKSMATEYQTKIADYQAKVNLFTDAIKKVKEKEILDLETRINEFQNSAQESVYQKKSELYAPILKKAEEAVKIVAKENGYTYIFDTSVGALLYFAESDDILHLVKSKLGI